MQGCTVPMAMFCWGVWHVDLLHEKVCMKMINVGATFHVCGIDTSGILQSYISYLSSYRKKNLFYVKKIKRRFVRVHRLHLYFTFFLYECYLRIDLVRLMKVIVHKKALRNWAPTPLFRLHRFKGPSACKQEVEKKCMRWQWSLRYVRHTGRWRQGRSGA